jgi:hypothetical protein
MSPNLRVRGTRADYSPIATLIQFERHIHHPRVCLLEAGVKRGAATYGEDHKSEESWAWGSLILGKTLLGQRVTDILAALEALRHHDGVAGLPLVVAARGEWTVPMQFAAVLDSNFAALYLSGGLLSYRNIVETEDCTHPFVNFVPGQRVTAP